MAWLKIDQTLRDHHKICDAADDLKLDPAHMTGMMVLLWLWAIDNAPTGSLAGISAGSIARGAQYTGDAEAFVEVLKRRNLLDDGPDGLQIHDWEETAGTLIEKRKKDAARKAAERETKKAEASAGRPEDALGKSATKSKSRERVRVDPSPDGEGEGTAVPYERIRLLWNDTCTSFPKVQGIAGKRKTALSARWKDRPDFGWWTAYFGRIEASDFLKGKNDRGWRATFDWILNEANMNKIIEGNYDTEGGDDNGPQQPEQYTRGFKD